MTESYIPLVTALASAAVGGAVALFGVYLTNKGNNARLSAQLAHQTQQQQVELRRARAEELYELVDKWLGNLFGYYIVKASIMQGKLTYNQGLDLELKNGESNQANFGRIEMLIDVYFPRVRGEYDRVLALRDAANKYVTLHKRAYERGETDGTAFLPAFSAEQRNLEGAATKLKEAVITEVRAV